MTQRVDELARHAGAAVRAGTADMDADGGLATVVRRGRRPRAVTAVGALLLLALAVPGAVWLRGLGEARVELQPPAAAPQPAPTVGSEDPAGSDDDPGVPGVPGVSTESEQPTSTPESAVTTTGGQTESAGPEPAGSFGTEEVSEGDFPFGGGEYTVLTDVRVAGHAGFDRVVLEFDGADMPSYRVSYVDPPLIQDGSGEEIPVDGSFFLELRLTPASGVESVDGNWERTYHGPYRLTGDTSVVTEVVRLDDFEANLAWVVGLPTRQPFAVSVLSDPLRLVVDIQAD